MNEDIFTSSAGDRSNVPNVGIVFTDGKANERPGETGDEAATARADGVHLIAVGISDRIDLVLYHIFQHFYQSFPMLNWTCLSRMRWRALLIHQMRSSWWMTSPT